MRGDTIHVLFGDDVAFVLRPEGEESHLLGECCVDGIMEEEMMGFVGEEAYEDFILM
jgi:hypothetical protein